MSIATTTTSVINTVNVPAVVTTTTYAACATTNIISTINGHDIDSFEVYDIGETDTTASSGYDCCVQCATTANCAVYNLLGSDCALSFQSGGPGTCSPGQQAGDLSAETAHGGFVVGNGACGTFDYENAL